MRKKVAFFSPLPPAATGTADYAAELIPPLRDAVDLQVFESAPPRFDPSRFDSIVYQIGNNPFHAEIYELALRHPGTVVLHEANLHDLIRGMTAHDRDAYAREIQYEIFGTEFPRRGDRPSQSWSSAFCMLRRLMDVSRACIVHNSGAESAVRTKGFRGPLRRIPHGVKARNINGAAFRAKLNIRAGQPVIGAFGYLRPAKLIIESLSVFRDLLSRVPDAIFLIAGAPHPEVPLRTEIASMGLANNVRVLGSQPEEDLNGYIAASDIVLNLRWPAYGESSGITARAIGMGKAVVVTRNSANLDMPNGTCIPVPYDPHMRRTLLETLTWLLSDVSVTGEIGRDAARWAEQNCTWEKVAAQYVEFLFQESQPALPKPRDSDFKKYLAQWTQPGSDRARYVEEHDVRLTRTLQLIPRGSLNDRVLEMGCYLQITPALVNVLGYGEVRGCYLGAGSNPKQSVTSRDGQVFSCEIDLFNCELDEFPYPDGHFATVLCCELLEHLERDPMRALAGIRRVLLPGGILLLTTPNATSLRSVSAVLTGQHPGYYTRYPDPVASPGAVGHRREYTPTEIEQLLTAAGFSVQYIATGPYNSRSRNISGEIADLAEKYGTPRTLRGDCIYAIGKKEDLPVNLRPSWLYDSPYAS